MLNEKYDFDPKKLDALKIEMLVEIYAELFGLRKFVAGYNAEKEGISEDQAMSDLLYASRAYRQSILHWIYEKYGVLPPDIMEALNQK